MSKDTYKQLKESFIKCIVEDLGNDNTNEEDTPFSIANKDYQKELDYKLWHACHYGNIREAKQAISQGANVNFIEGRGSPFEEVLREDKPESPDDIRWFRMDWDTRITLAMMLVKSANFEVNRQNEKTGNTPLLNALPRLFMMDIIIEILLKKGADPYIKNNEGKNVFNYFTDEKRKNYINEILKEHGFETEE